MKWIKGEKTGKKTVAPLDTADDTAAEQQADILAEIDRLAALSLVEYEVVRHSVAKRLEVRTAYLDTAVAQKRQEAEPDPADDIFTPVSPWGRPVAASLLLTEIAETIRSFVSCPPEAAKTAALWVALSWMADAVYCCPLLIISSPERRCGKSTLLAVLGHLVRRPILAGNISSAALFEVIDEWQPTLLIDDCGAAMKANKHLRGIITSGHTRDTASTIRAAGEDQVPTRFSTFGPKVLSETGKLPTAIMERAIVLKLRRKLPTEKIARLRYADPTVFHALRRKLARFADDARESVLAARPAIPTVLHDRAADNWEPLLAIASVAGDDWLKAGASAAVKLSRLDNATTPGTELLADIQKVFERRGIDRISTTDMIAALCEDAEKPWSTYHRGGPIKPRQLADKLREYGIVSRNIRINHASGVAKGYDRSQFAETFSRYVSPLLSATGDNSCVSGPQRGTDETDIAVPDPFLTLHVTELQSQYSVLATERSGYEKLRSG